MKLQNIMQKLVKIAKILDKDSMFREADDITYVMKRLSNMESEGLHPGIQAIKDKLEGGILKIMKVTPGLQFDQIKDAIPSAVKTMLIESFKAGEIPLEEITVHNAVGEMFINLVKSARAGLAEPDTLNKIDQLGHVIFDIKSDEIAQSVLADIQAQNTGTDPLSMIGYDPLSSMGYGEETGNNTSDPEIG
jgi:hypothetical protein